jgi:hypothetical protein
MHLPMRSDMFRRSDYAHGGVVHFAGGGLGFKEAIEDLYYGKDIYRPTKLPNAADAEDQRYGESINKKPAAAAQNPNAGIELLPNAPTGGGGGGLGINKDIRETLDYLKKQRNEPLPKAQSIEEQEAEREKRGLDKLPTTDTSQLQDVLKSYNKPRTWDENLQLMAEDAASARPGAGFTNMAVGRSGRALDAVNRQKSIEISLKLEDIKNLDAKAQFAFKNGNFEAAKKFTQEAEKLRADIMEKRGTVAAHTLTGLASLERANNAGIASGMKGGTGLTEQTLAKLDSDVADFIESPNLNSKFWDYVPNGDKIKEKIALGKPGDNNYKTARAELQKFKSDITKGYENRLRSGEAEQVRKQVR